MQARKIFVEGFKTELEIEKVYCLTEILLDANHYKTEGYGKHIRLEMI